MFAFIFQITIYAGTNEHSERGSYCIIVAEDVKIHADWKEQKEDGMHQSKLFRWRLPECHQRCEIEVGCQSVKWRFLIHQVVSESASEHEINKWLVPVCFWFIFDGSDVSMEVKGPVVYSSRPRGPRGRGVNRLSAAQESFHQDRECNPMEILESSEARDGE